ncbi:MAG: 50S ribosomal protein L13 [Clostridia bacterium]|jgi:ribosomal protein L13, bacterial type|nr:50S ribosomal protein L13 [Clostridia bacterium]
MNTYMANAQNVQRKWYIVDATDIPLGRLASQVAAVLRGKNKPTFTPHVDTGDYVIVVNTDKVALTGKKLEQKMKRHHTLYMGGMKEVQYKTFMATKSDRAVYDAVKGMLPKNSLGRKMLKKLRVYKDANHEHEAQKPEKLAIVYKRADEKANKSEER